VTVEVTTLMRHARSSTVDPWVQHHRLSCHKEKVENIY